MSNDTVQDANRVANTWPRPVIGDLSGAFADLGTFLPLVVAILALRRFDPTSVLVGFGVFALAVALIYRRPIPVQPMKVFAALIIAGGLSGEAVAAGGVLVGVVLCLLAVTGAVGALAQRVPPAVLAGITAGVGINLAIMGGRLALGEPLVGISAAVLLVGVWLSPLRPLASLALLLLGVGWGLAHLPGELPALSLGVHLPQLVIPQWPDWRVASEQALLPQLALTVTNAVLVPATLAASYFPADKARMSPVCMAWSSGILNLLLAPFGALPMCHGAGGLVVQYRFGARSALAPLLFGLSCLLLGLFFGASALMLLQIVPVAAVGVLLLFAGVDLALGRHLQVRRAADIIVVGLTASICVLINVAAGLVVGWAGYLILQRWTNVGASR